MVVGSSFFFTDVMFQMPRMPGEMPTRVAIQEVKISVWGFDDKTGGQGLDKKRHGRKFEETEDTLSPSESG